MIELDASQVLTFRRCSRLAKSYVAIPFEPVVRERRRIFRYSEQVKEILEKLPAPSRARPGPGSRSTSHSRRPLRIRMATSRSILRRYQSKVSELGKPVWSVEAIPTPEPDVPAHVAATQIANAVTEQSRAKREELKDEYGLTLKQLERDLKNTSSL